MCDDCPLTDTWRMMEQFYYEGYARAIGISNFNEQQIREVFAKADIKPMNHQVPPTGSHPLQRCNARPKREGATSFFMQIQIEVNLLWPNYELVKFSKRMGMTVTGYCCLGSPGRQAAVLKDDWPGKTDAAKSDQSVECERRAWAVLSSLRQPSKLSKYLDGCNGGTKDNISAY